MAFEIEPATLFEWNENKDSQAVHEYGGIGALAKALRTDVRHGLDPLTEGETSVEGRKEYFGANTIRYAPPKSFFGILLEQLQDPTLMLLMFAATVSTALGFSIKEQREHQEYIEGIAIWGAVVLVSLIGASNDYQKDQQFRKLNAHKDMFDVKAIRGGKSVLVANAEIVVGDILVLDTGDKIIADGVMFEGNGLVVDEASLTGESDPIKKNAEADFWCRSGTQVTEGDGKMLVVAVGEQSEWGKTLSMVIGEGDETPLQEKLAVLAGAIGKLGILVATLSFIVLMIRWFIDYRGDYASHINQNGPVEFFLLAVTIVVVAVPEGLPLAVTIALAYSMRRMMKDNNFVRHLAACETMGGATAICSDKTGTLTENRMTVVEGWFAGVKLDHAPMAGELRDHVRHELAWNVCLNSKAFLIDHGRSVEFVGNRTECALLVMAKNWGWDYKAVRDEQTDNMVRFWGFSSAKKMASCMVRLADGNLRLYNKGASEMVLEECTHMYDEAGSIVELTQANKAHLIDIVNEMANRGLRTLAITYADYPGRMPPDESPDHDLVVMAIVGIKDPVRKEVPAAVDTCTRAGIRVRMVTGDNINTARFIARECGILTDDGIALEGPVFRRMSEAELMQAVPRLQVLARSSPTDKHTLVKHLRKQQEVVAVTGDGTNDAPALKEADVGLAMGIAGTEVAKEAADIVILDDNFNSIVKSVLWGRAVFSNIRKFLMFQLTINLVALMVAFIGSIVQRQPLNVLQLLWVNLIMDTMAALALATELPHPSLLNHKPHGRNEQLISSIMWKHMAVQGLYQVFWIVLIMFAAEQFIDKYEVPSACNIYAQTCAQCKRYVDGNCENPDFNTVAERDGYHREGIESKYRNAAGDKLTAKDLSLCLFNLFEVESGECVSVDQRPGKEEEVCEVYVDNEILQELFPLSEEEVAAGVVCPQEYVKSARNIAKEMRKRLERLHEKQREPVNSLIFNSFIWMQIFNEINARKIQDEYNVFEGLFTNYIFMGVLLFTAIFQIIIIEVPPLASVFSVTPLDWHEWLVSLAIGFGAIPLSFLTRLISRNFFASRESQDLLEVKTSNHA